MTDKNDIDAKGCCTGPDAEKGSGGVERVTMVTLSTPPDPFSASGPVQQPLASMSFLSVILATSYSLSSADGSPPSVRLSSSRSKWICRAGPV